MLMIVYKSKEVRMLDSNTYEEPTNLDNAEEFRVRLTGDIQIIQAQLGDRQRLGDNGKRLSSREYWLWKKDARCELNRKLDNLRAVKLWIRDNNSKKIDDGYPIGLAVRHVSNLYQLLQRLKEEGVEMDDSEEIQISEAREFLGIRV